jgi:hypothetical protein
LADVREDILARLLAVLATIPTIKTAQRNNRIPDELLPQNFSTGDKTDDANDLSMHPLTGRRWFACTRKSSSREVRRRRSN